MPTRRMARELALQALFSVEVGHREPADVLDETFAHAGSSSEQRVFIKDLVYGTLEHAPESDLTVGPLLQGWTIERLPTIDRLLLRMSMFEFHHRPATPRPVIINEAVELAKKFSTENSGRFVNGVLSSATAPKPVEKNGT
ncbi:MAG: transcription antitermination factor NusB [Candidatus Eremiobacteraeota bacterium]|nr:transcription antitermination factor NusB [Candidatus Eremiobacteraeota bacterium]